MRWWRARLCRGSGLIGSGRRAGGNGQRLLFGVLSRWEGRRRTIAGRDGGQRRCQRVRRLEIFFGMISFVRKEKIVNSSHYSPTTATLFISGGAVSCTTPIHHPSIPKTPKKSTTLKNVRTHRTSEAPLRFVRGKVATGETTSTGMFLGSGRQGGEGSRSLYRGGESSLCQLLFVL